MGQERTGTTKEVAVAGKASEGQNGQMTLNSALTRKDMQEQVIESLFVTEGVLVLLVTPSFKK